MPPQLPKTKFPGFYNAEFCQFENDIKHRKMNTLGYICDWGLRRLFKLFLKRHLSNLLATEVDVEQLSVQLETGSLELKECLLDVEYLNESFLVRKRVILSYKGR